MEDPTIDASALEQAACEAARRAGEVLSSRFRQKAHLIVERKGLHDFVTEVDREAEAAVLEHLHARFPSHAVMAEEGSPLAAASAFRWFVDPLDGTTNFIHGVPVFCASVAVEDSSGLVAGAIHDPVHDELFHARRGGGAWLGDLPIRCSRPSDPGVALVATGFPFRELDRLDSYLEAFERFVRVTAGLRRAGSAALDLAFTACGRYDGFFEIGLSPWDVAAGALLVREAGGIVTDVTGGDSFLATGDIVASGPGLHGTMVAITARSFGATGKVRGPV